MVLENTPETPLDSKEIKPVNPKVNQLHVYICSHELKRRLLLGRKAMTNLDSVLKTRDITLSSKVCLVKAMVFPVVVYGCESWTIKKAEHQRTDAFECGAREDS